MAKFPPHQGLGQDTPLATYLGMAAGRALETVPFLLVAGTVAYGPLDSAMAGVGVAGAFLAAILAPLAMLWLADRRGLVAGPSLGLALILAGTLDALRTHRLLDPGDVGGAIGIAMLLTSSCGLVVAGVARLGMGRMAAVVPYPVLVGLRNGTAILLIVEQLQPAAGMSHGEHGHPQFGAVLVVLATIAAMRFGRHQLPSVPPIVRGLAAGLLVHHGLAALAVPGLAVGPAVEATVPHLPQLLAGWQGLAQPPGSAALAVMLPALASMILLCVFETAAAASALQSAAGERGSGRGDLLAVAVTNLAGSLFAALPAAGSLEETVPAAHHPLPRVRSVHLMRVLVLALLAAITLPNLHRMPAAALAGVIIVAALEIGDLASLRVMATKLRAGRRQRIEGVGNILILAAVTAVAVAANLATAVLVGSLIALAVFVADMATGPVRRRYAAPIGRSRARRGDRDSETLLREGDAIGVVELHGALFFASADQIVGELESAVLRHRYVILDLNRLHRADMSGARSLLSACDRLWRANRWIALAGLHPGVTVWDDLAASGLAALLHPDRCFGTLEDAMAAAEEALLHDVSGGPTLVALAPIAALQGIGLPAVAVPALLARMHTAGFEEGSAILRAGDPGGALFLLLDGQVDVLLPAREGGHRVRLATLSPGTLFGEMALLTGGPRSADLIARGQVNTLRLDPDALARLRSENPDAAWHLLRAIALQIDLNLRLANAAIASFEA